MRLHEVFEACVEYVAVEGVLGCDPSSLQHHLSKLDSSIDSTFFTYILTLLSRHPAIQFVLSTYPIPDENGNVQLGSAPLPSDYVDPSFAGGNVDDEAVQPERIKGRQLAFHLAGEQYRTDKEAAQDKRAMQEKRRKEKRSAARRGLDFEDENIAGPRNSVIDQDGETMAKPEEESDGLLRVLGEDDGDEEGIRVMKTDLRGLMEKWGSRLRIRCTDDDIYFRLVGTHHKNPKISPVVFLILQLAARSRGKGITTIELGPLVGATQGSMHHYMKVLVSLRLCVKVPAIKHASITNLLLFHRFVDQNENYRAIAKTDPLQAAYSMEDKGDEIAIDNDPESVDAFGLGFAPMTDSDLMIGLVAKERLVKLLDHPMLKNHLLKERNLLALLGWHGETAVRHRRALPRHVDSMILDCIVERVDVGEKGVTCLRLVKYNPDSERTDVVDRDVTEQKAEDLAFEADTIMDSSTYSEPFNRLGGVSITTTPEYQLNLAVMRAGSAGLIIADVQKQLDGMFKRFLEFHVLRSETVYVPPHLRNLAICSVMESHGRERRLRAFGISAFREMLQAQGQAVDDSVNPPEPPESGHWGDQRFRRFYTSQDQFNRYLDTHHYGHADPADPDGLKMLGRPRKAFAASRRLQPQAKHLAGEKKRLADFPGGGTHANVDATLTPMKKKGRRYPNDVQHRGRPRKYIQVVELDGRINRNIIGSVHATPELPSCLIYVKAKNILVDAPPGYPGVGVPPPLSAEDVKKGKPPKYYSKFPKLKPPIKSRGDRSGKKRKKRKHGDETTETISKPSKRIKKEKILRDEDPGEREQMDADIQIEAEVDELDSDDGVGEAGPGPSTIKNQLGAREDSTDEAAQEKAYVDQAILPVASITEPATQAGEMEKTPILDRKKKRTSRKSEGHSTAHDSAADAELITFPPDALESGTHQAELVDPAARLQDRGSSDIRSTLAESSTANQKQMRTSRKKGKATETIGMDAATASTEKAAYLSTFADEVPVRSTRGKKRKSSPEPLQSIPPSAVEATDPLTATAAPSTPDGIPGTKGLRKRKSTAFTDGAHPDSTLPSTQAITLTPTGKKRGRPRKTPAARSFPSPVIGERLLSDYSIPEPPDDVPIQTEFELPETLARVIAKGAERNLDELERSEPHREMEKAQDLRQSGETRDIAVPPQGAPKYAKLASRRRLPPLINAHIAGNITVDHLPASGTPGQNVALSTPPSPPPAQPPQQIQSNATRKSGWVMEGTPINEIDPKAEVPARATSHGPSKARPDFSFVRRANEICQALKEAGGVLTDHKLLQEHRDWAVRVARTSAPFAPAIAAGMDRQVFKRAIRTIVYQGRLKETIATIPTTTGRWQKAGVLYIPEIGQADVQAYIRKLSDMTQQAFAPKRVPRTKIAATQFTEIRLPCGRPSLTRVQATPQQAATAATGVELSGAERRATLLKDPNTISYLYGFKSGRNLRLETLHRAMVHAMADGQQSESLVSTLPRIFALPFLLEDITVADWFACFFTTWYDEALEQFLADPETRMTKLRDIPRHIRPPGGFNGNGAKSKLFSMLAAMTDLKLVTPLVAVGDAEATLSTPRRGGFQPSGSSSLAAHYLVHEVAPVYHIAADEAALLGTLPVKTPAEIDKYWAIMKDACLETNINRLPILDNSHGSEAPLKPTFEGSLESHKLLQSLQRWRHCIRLLPVQRAVLDEAVDKRTGMRLISVEEMDRIAYEYALPRNAVQEQIDRRVGFFRDREAQREQRAQQDKHKAKDRHERAERTLREKIAERHAQTKQAWEERIRVSAERLGIAFGPALIDLVSRQTLSTTQRAESAEMTEKKLDEIVRLFERNRLIGSGPSPGQIQPAPRKARLAPRTRKEKRAKARDANKPVVRRRRNWTKEDEDILLDAEAIIRARSRGQPNARGRAAMIQIFPEVSPQTYHSRLKKMLTEPGKQAYFERLEDAWHDIWVEHRGTDALPDPNPQSIYEFDLPAHLRFLRERVVKYNLRLAAAAGSTIAKEKAPGLPQDMDSLIDNYRWTYRSSASYGMASFTEQLAGEEQKLALLSLAPLMHEASSQPENGVDRTRGVISGILKMIIATPLNIYNQEVATKLLSPFPKSETNGAIILLNDEKVIHKQSAADTARFFGFTSAWLALNEGPLPETLQDEALSLSETLGPVEKGVDWPLIGKSGNLASLMSMVSGHEVDFEFDVDEIPSVKHDRDRYNTRALNDDAFEFDFRVVRDATAPAASQAQPLSTLSCKAPTPWMTTPEESPELVTAVESVIHALATAREAGCTKSDLEEAIEYSASDLAAILAVLARERPARVFWAGYDTARLVSVDVWPAWAASTVPRKVNARGEVVVTGKERRCRPRKWTNLYGELQHNEWNKAVKAVLGYIIVRPGQTEAFLRSNLARILDRIETNEVLEHLLEKRSARRTYALEVEGRSMPPVEATDVSEEGEIVWWPAEDRVWR